MMNEKLTIIVPVYNGSKRIKKCLESIYCQTYSNIELILLDDGSKDNSYRVMSDIVEQHKSSSVKVILEKQENQGVAATRNKGIRMATGDYVTFVDQDDILDREYCCQYMEEAQKSHPDILVGGYERVTDSGKIKKRVRMGKNPWERYIVVAPWAHIYKREFLLKHQIRFLATGIGEDVYFNLLAYAATQEVYQIDNVGYKWIYNEASVSNSTQNTINEKVDPLYLLERIYQDIPDKSYFKQEYTEYFFARYICWYILFSFRGSSKKDVEKMLNRLLKWLEDCFPHYRKNRYLYFHKPKGEGWPISVMVRLFYLLQRLRVLSFVLKVFC